MRFYIPKLLPPRIIVSPLGKSPPICNSQLFLFHIHWVNETKVQESLFFFLQKRKKIATLKSLQFLCINITIVVERWPSGFNQVTIQRFEELKGSLKDREWIILLWFKVLKSFFFSLNKFLFLYIKDCIFIATIACSIVKHIIFYETFWLNLKMHWYV